MTSGAPTLDRLTIGLLAGAALGAPIISAAMSIMAGSFGGGVWRWFFTALLLFVPLALVAPLVQAPLWIFLRWVRLPDSVASTLAGGLSFLALSIFLMVAGGDYFGYPPLVQLVATLVSWGFAGLVAGVVAWRVARFEIS